MNVCSERNEGLNHVDFFRGEEYGSDMSSWFLELTTNNIPSINFYSAVKSRL